MACLISIFNLGARGTPYGGGDTTITGHSVWQFPVIISLHLLIVCCLLAVGSHHLLGSRAPLGTGLQRVEEGQIN